MTEMIIGGIMLVLLEPVTMAWKYWIKNRNPKPSGKPQAPFIGRFGLPTSLNFLSANKIRDLCEACSGSFGMARLVEPKNCENCKETKPPRLREVKSEKPSEGDVNKSFRPHVQEAVKASTPPSKPAALPPRPPVLVAHQTNIFEEAQVEDACFKTQLEAKRKMSSILEYRIKVIKSQIKEKSLQKVVSKDTIKQMKIVIKELEQVKKIVRNGVLYKRGSWRE